MTRICQIPIEKRKCQCPRVSCKIEYGREIEWYEKNYRDFTDCDFSLGEILNDPNNFVEVPKNVDIDKK